MSNQQHPITPPPELVASLRNAAPTGIRDAGVTRELHLIAAAYAAGADQELEACCADIHTVYGKKQSDWLRSMRRPKPPSLKKQALKALHASVGLDEFPEQYDTIRRALEQLPN